MAYNPLSMQYEHSRLKWEVAADQVPYCTMV